jgi:hypothetical protein
VEVEVLSISVVEGADASQPKQNWRVPADAETEYTLGEAAASAFERRESRAWLELIS